MLFLAWPALFLLVDGAESPRRAARVGWQAGAAFFLSGLYWVGEAFLVEAANVWWYLPLMPVAVAALGAGLGLFWGAAFWAARRFWPTGWRRAPTLAAAILAAEVARGHVLTGFPWAMQAYAWIETPLIQVASLTGGYALSGLTLLAAMALGLRSAAPAAMVAAALATAWSWGAWRVADATPEPGPVLRLVQPNTRQVDKWAPENTRPIFENLVALTAQPADGPPPALVVWPEVAVTFLFDESVEAQAIATAALPPGASLAVGSVRIDRAAPDRPLFNSLLFYGPDGAPLGVYDKRRLAPFGEYVPYAWLLGRLGFGTLGDGLSGFTPGDGAPPPVLPGLPPFAALICYEIIFPAFVRAAARDADWALQVTNDAWFGRSAGPWQHLAQARVRAVELGLPIARAAKTGVSAMIDPWGRVTARLGLDERGVVDSPLPGPRVPTLYARLGDWPPLAFMAMAFGLARLRRV